ncbi:hypothetical protein C8Q80DRAFT_1149159 [Daedaleopsis nitida]|nr:hypothetical protein C8Q80DRAFT_1149159 [Daedaleopsis nitida]
MSPRALSATRLLVLRRARARPRATSRSRTTRPSMSSGCSPIPTTSIYASATSESESLQFMTRKWQRRTDRAPEVVRVEVRAKRAPTPSLLPHASARSPPLRLSRPLTAPRRTPPVPQM